MAYSAAQFWGEFSLDPILTPSSCLESLQHVVVLRRGIGTPVPVTARGALAAVWQSVDNATRRIMMGVIDSEHMECLLGRLDAG
jgi:hypothetical protein